MEGESMPFDRKLYPADWEQIRARVLDRANGCCECSGQCGNAHEGDRCNIPNYAIIKRDCRQPARWEIHGGCSLCLGGDPECKTIQVVLTVAHYPDPTPSNCDERNLLALCQRCHNLVDMPMRREHARVTRMARKAIGTLRGVL
jgi:hypothetical protein